MKKANTMKHAVRLCSVSAGLLALAACQSTPTPLQREAAALDASLAPVDALPAQRLRSGQCGLFLFEVQPPRNFVVFEDEAARTVQLVHEGAIHTLGVSPQGGSLAPGTEFRRVYLDQDDNRTFILSGDVGEETGSGPRLENVLLEVRELDGTRTVRPLGGVRSCGN